MKSAKRTRMKLLNERKFKLTKTYYSVGNPPLLQPDDIVTVGTLVQIPEKPQKANIKILSVGNSSLKDKSGILYYTGRDELWLGRLYYGMVAVSVAINGNKLIISASGKPNSEDCVGEWEGEEED